MEEQFDFDWDEFSKLYNYNTESLKTIIPEELKEEETIPSGFFTSSNEDEYCLDLLDIIKGQVLSISDDTDLVTLSKVQLEKYRKVLACMNKHINSTVERIESLMAAKKVNGYTTFDDLRKFSEILFRK